MKNLFKKVVAVQLLATLMLCAFTACGSSSGDASDDSTVTAEVIEVDLTSEEYAFGVDKSQEDLLESVNAFIEKIESDGTMDEIFDKYFGDGEPEAVESAELDSSKDQLIVATNAAFEPFEYTEGDSYYGIDMEIAALLAEELGLELVIQNMDFDAVCLSVSQGTCDIAMAGLTVNEEREEYVTFSTSYYSASQRLIVRSDDTTFDDCTDLASVEEKLAELSSDVNIGVQQGTTAQYYVEGSEDWGFDGLAATCVTYKNGSLAVQDMLNGNIDYVIIDAAPAASITESINELL